MEWSVFIQRAMNPAFIIVGGELDEDPTQVGLPEHDQVVDALPPDGANQSFRKTVLPRRAGRDRLVANAHGAQAAGDSRTVNGVTVADQVAWCLIPGKSFSDLPRNPFCRRMRRHIDPDQLAPRQPNNDEGVEQAKANSWNDEQIDGGDVRHVIAKERAPALTGRRLVTLLGHVLGHCRLRHRKAKLEQLAMNVRCPTRRKRTPPT